jgi:hypothetical protein
VCAFGDESLQSLFAIRRFVDVSEPDLLQRGPDKGAHRQLIIDDKHANAGRGGH